MTDVGDIDATGGASAVVDFIERDVTRARRAVAPWLGAVLAGLAVALALAWREDYVGVAKVAYLAPTAAMLALVAALPAVAGAGGFGARGKLALGGALLAAVLGVSLVHPGFAETNYVDAAAFWREALRCFGKGLATSGVAALFLAWAWSRWLPAPGAAARLVLAGAATAAGVAMLNLHCSATNWGHVIAGHWAQGAPMLAFAAAVQRWWLARRLRAALPALYDKNAGRVSGQ